MTHSIYQPARFIFVAGLLTAMTLSACATKPDRRGPPPEDIRSGQKPKTSGTFLHPIAALFVSMDTNNDRMTSRAELESGTEQEWAGFDRPPSAVYFAPWVRQNLGSVDASPNFMSFDRDFNGVVTEQEFTEGLSQEFDKLDKNRDGQLTRSEMIVAFAAPQGQRSRGRGQEGRPEKGSRGGGRPSR
ncbi:hypothetical protein [Fretibacter rubidus]|uniref:hypothetical protein n=1 Tax=Fretibacter rubidus TaxID=570162 RepID=UPI00352A3B07